ncbi:MAG: MBL fold metallo-hydrolase [Bacteroidales bacterium]
MLTFTTSKGNRVIRVLSGRSNSYLIKMGLTNILIDPGLEISSGRLLKNLVSANCNKLDYLILTHTHFDHCSAVNTITKRFPCKVVVSKYEKEFARNGFTPIPEGTNFFSRMVVNMGVKFENIVGHYKPFDTAIEVGEILDLFLHGVNIKIIHTPGHSAGSLTIIADNEISITGDTLFGVFRKSVMPPFANDVNLLLKSWKVLIDSGCKRFLPGHGGEIDRELLINQYNYWNYEKGNSK